MWRCPEGGLPMVALAQISHRLRNWRWRRRRRWCRSFGKLPLWRRPELGNSRPHFSLCVIPTLLSFIGSNLLACAQAVAHNTEKRDDTNHAKKEKEEVLQVQ